MRLADSDTQSAGRHTDTDIDTQRVADDLFDTDNDMRLADRDTQSAARQTDTDSDT